MLLVSSVHVSKNKITMVVQAAVVIFIKQL